MTIKEKAKRLRKLKKESAALQESQKQLRQQVQYQTTGWSVLGGAHGRSHHDRMADFAAKMDELNLVICEKTIEETALYIELTTALDEQDLTGDTKLAVLNYLNGCTNKEIARSLHSKEDNVRSRIKRALNAMDLRR